MGAVTPWPPWTANARSAPDPSPRPGCSRFCAIEPERAQRGQEWASAQAWAPSTQGPGRACSKGGVWGGRPVRGVGTHRPGQGKCVGSGGLALRAARTEFPPSTVPGSHTTFNEPTQRWVTAPFGGADQ
ncbi:hypothetical protein GCM10009872_59490 [Actinopolymorpha rutila]